MFAAHFLETRENMRGKGVSQSLTALAAVVESYFVQKKNGRDRRVKRTSWPKDGLASTTLKLEKSRALTV